MKTSEIFDKVKEIIVDKCNDLHNSYSRNYNIENITIESKLGEDDIGMDSLDVIEVTMLFEEQFDIEELPDEALVKIAEDGNKISDIVDLIASHLK